MLALNGWKRNLVWNCPEQERMWSPPFDTENNLSGRVESEQEAGGVVLSQNGSQKLSNQPFVSPPFPAQQGKIQAGKKAKKAGGREHLP